MHSFRQKSYNGVNVRNKIRMPIKFDAIKPVLANNCVIFG